MNLGLATPVTHPWSFGHSGYDFAWANAVRAAGNAGVLVSVATYNDTVTGGVVNQDVDGNNGSPDGLQEANIIAVTATDRNDALFAGYGVTTVDIAAPGEEIYSTDWVQGDNFLPTWSYQSGSSMAAPQIAATLALLRAEFPLESHFQILNRLFSATDDLPSLEGKVQTGGRLNLNKALGRSWGGYLSKSSPFNDNFADAALIVHIPSTGVGNNIDASSETNEPSYLTGGRSVWWKWKWTFDPEEPENLLPSEIWARTHGSGCNTLLAVYTGTSLGNLTEVTYSEPRQSEDGCETWTQVAFVPAADTTYYFAVDGQGGAEGVVMLTVEENLTAPPGALYFDLTEEENLQRDLSAQTFSVKLKGPPNAEVRVAFSVDMVIWQEYLHKTVILDGNGDGVWSETEVTFFERAIYRAYIINPGGAQTRSCNVIGFSDQQFAAGKQMIANPFTAVGGNTVGKVLSGSWPNATLSKWDEDEQKLIDNETEYDSQKDIYTWKDQTMTLAPGEGAILDLLSARTFTFMGEVQQGYMAVPLATGSSIRSTQTPLDGLVKGSLKCPIFPGDKVFQMVNGEYVECDYGDEGWSPHEPRIAVGESFWIFNGTPGVVVGAGTSSNAGSVYVYPGGRPEISSKASWSYTGGQSGAQFGFSLAGGDINGDGAGDLIIGEPYWDAGGISNKGRTRVLYGPLPLSGQWGSNYVDLEGTQTNQREGYSVSYVRRLVTDGNPGLVSGGIGGNSGTGSAKAWTWDNN